MSVGFKSEYCVFDGVCQIFLFGSSFGLSFLNEQTGFIPHCWFADWQYL